MYLWKGKSFFSIKRPYNGNNRKEIKENIAARQIKLTDNEKPWDWSDASMDFVNSLLLRKQNQRLGCNRPGSAKFHPWFLGFDWEGLENKTLLSPFFGTVNYLIFYK